MVLSSPALTPYQKTSLEIKGGGYFRLLDRGHIVYAKKGSLLVRLGEVMFGTAHLLPTVSAPKGTLALEVSGDGIIYSKTSSGKSEVGRIVLAVFPASEIMGTYHGYLTADDRPSLAYPNQLGAGTLVQITNSPPHPWIKSHPSEAVHKIDHPKITKKLEAVADYKSPQKSSQQAPKALGQQPSPGAASTSSKQVEIIVHPQCRVTSQRFTFADIADVTGPSNLVDAVDKTFAGYAPSLGFSRQIDKGLLMLRLMGAHLNPNQVDLVVPPGATVELSHQTLSSDELLAYGLSAIAPLTGGITKYGPIYPVQPLTIPNGKVDIETSNPMPSGTAGYFVTVTASENGEIIGTRSISLGPVPGSISVRAGDPVTVTLKAGYATVTVPGTVVNQAFLGQTVQVRITSVSDHPTIQSGILTSSNSVQVKL